MKLSVGKRILMFIHWLFSLLICVAFALYLIAPEFIMKYYGIVESAVTLKYLRIIGIALLVIYAALAIVQIYLIFKRRKRSDRGFITVDSSDTGKVRIAISAIEQMVRQSVTNIDGITEMKINIDNQDDAIMIGVNASIVNGSHVPTITMNMQRAIRQFVEMNCGVAVRSVSININAVTNAAEAPRRKRLGRGKAEGTAPAEPVAPTAPVTNEPPRPAWITPDPEPLPVTPEPEPEPEPAYEADDKQSGAVAETPVFDFDKPYESEFAKDLAAMKAAEQEAVAEPDALGDDEQ